MVYVMKNSLTNYGLSEYQRQQKVNEHVLNRFLTIPTEVALPYEAWKYYRSTDPFWEKDANMHVREAHIIKRGFPIITCEQLDILEKIFKQEKLIEVACGSGWLTERLRERQLDVIGVDNHSGRYGFPQYKNAVVEDAVFYIQKANFDVLVMTWPDYNTSFAHDIVETMPSGTVLVYQGENHGGCTADDAFFDYLNNYCRELQGISDALNKYRINFMGIHDFWMVFQKI